MHTHTHLAPVFLCMCFFFLLFFLQAQEYEFNSVKIEIINDLTSMFLSFSRMNTELFVIILMAMTFVCITAKKNPESFYQEGKHLKPVKFYGELEFITRYTAISTNVVGRKAKSL